MKWGLNWLVGFVGVVAVWAGLGLGGSYVYMFYRVHTAGTPAVVWTALTTPAVVIFGALLGVPFGAFFVWPVWLITRPEPGRGGKQVVRRATRWSAVLAGAAGLLTIVVVYVFLILVFTVGWWLYVACLVLWGVALLGVNLLLIRLAWLAPQRGMAVEHVFVLTAIVLCGWGIGTCIGLVISGTVTAFLGIHESVTAGALVFALVMVLAFLLLCALMIGLLLWWVVLLVRYRAMIAGIHAQMTGGIG